MRSFLHSLKFKIFIVVVGLFSAGMILETSIWMKSTVRQAGNTAAQNLYSSLKVSNQNLESIMKDVDKITALLCSNIDGSQCIYYYLEAMEPGATDSDEQKVQYSREVYQYLFQLCNYKYYLNGMAVYNTKGSRQSFGIVMNEKDLESQSWFQEFMESDENFCVIPVHRSLPSDKNYETLVFSILRKIKYGNTVRGVVLADIKYEILSEFYNFEKITDYQIVITDEECNHIIYPENTRIEADELEILKVFGEDQQAYSVQKMSGKKSLFLKVQMPFTRWNIFGILEYRTLIADFLKTLYRVLIINILITVLVCATVASTMFYMTRDLSGLTMAVQELDMDNLELDLFIGSDDEIGILYKQICNMLGRIRNLIDQIQISESKKRELEIAALQEQINPHFLYNTLNTISMLASFRGIKNIQEVSKALSDIMHLALNPTRYITVEQEVAYVKRYLEIMEYKYSGKFTTEYEVEDAVRLQMIPKLILQPIVENSLRHGIATISRPGKILIIIKQCGRYLDILIKDNGKGMPVEVTKTLSVYSAEEVQREKHIGVQNVRERLHLIYRDECSFTVTSKVDEFTEVKIRIPLTEDQEIQV